MIVYTKAYGGLFLIFRVVGTSWPAGVVPGLLAGGTSLALGAWQGLDDHMRSRGDFIAHPYAFGLFASLLGIILVFRTNFSYSRYWEAISMVQAMGAKWMDGALMGTVFDAGGINKAPLLYGAQDRMSRQPHTKHASHGGPTHLGFFNELAHICSLLHALALLHLRQDSDLDNLEYAHFPGIPAPDGLQQPPTQPASKSCNQDSDLDDSARTADWQRLAAASHGKAGPPGRDGRRPSVISDGSHGSSVGTADTPCRIGKGPMSPRSVTSEPVFPEYSREIIAAKYSQQRLPVLGGLSNAERQALESFGGEPVSTEARVTMVATWYMRRLIARQKFEQGDSRDTSPPITSRLYQVISDGNLWFSHASKISITPFPFPYSNLLSILLWIYTFLAPVLINGCIMETTIRCVFSFMAVLPYHALAAVGDNLEDPFLSYDVNELPLPEIQRSVNLRLLCFGVVPEWESQSYDTPAACQPAGSAPTGMGPVKTGPTHLAVPGQPPVTTSSHQGDIVLDIRVGIPTSTARKRGAE